MKGPLSSFPIKKPLKRSSRIRKSREKATEVKRVVVDQHTRDRWEQIETDYLANWLQKEFPVPNEDDSAFAAYFDEYAKNNKSIERRCFGCKEVVQLSEAFICSSSKCPKVYHKKCVKDNNSNLCPLHFCFSCNSRVRGGTYCHMCPTTYCTACDVTKHKETKHMTLCCTCAAVSSTGGLYNIIDDLL